MTSLSMTTETMPRGSLLTMATAMLATMLAAVAGWRSRTVSVRALAELDDRMLRDIGMTRSEWRREISKPFFRG